MTGISMKQLWLSPMLVLSLGAGCGSSKTVHQISAFADKVCACADAACAKAVQTEYEQWWSQNQRARGSEGDRKDVEKAMERYAQCHLNLVGPEPVEAPVEVPKVDLEPAAVPAPTVPPSAPTSAPNSAPSAPPKAPESPPSTP